jgi:hypothetical protein
MPQFIPALDPNTLTNNAERETALALMRLPARYRIYHGYLFLERQRSQTGREYFREGEIDFILFDPHRGILVLEVKGGSIRYDPTKGWYREETRKTIRPFAQARDNMHALMDRIHAQPEFYSRRPNLVHGYAVVVPHCNYRGTLPADVQAEVLLGFDDMPHLADRIDTLLHCWSRRDNIAPLDVPTIRGVQAALEAELNLLTVLSATLSEQEAQLRRATDEQARILEYLRNHRRASFNGVAGSGKTLLALMKAKDFAREGLKTLLVCYNRPLADWLSEQIPEELRERVHVSTFHSLCQTMAMKAGIDFHGTKNDEFWLYEAPDRLEQAAKLLSEADRFDAMVVDEGQDFPSIWFPALRLITKSQDDHFPLYWFFDPRQNLYVSEDHSAEMPNLGVCMALGRNCRNTKRIAKRCGEIINEEVQGFEAMAEGEEICEIQTRKVRETVKELRKQVEQWIQKSGRLRPEQIAILTPDGPGEEWPTVLSGLEVKDDFRAWREGKCILHTTHRRFKGLEADALILAGVPKEGVGKRFTKADSYVACSRAKLLLTVIRCEEG